MKNIALVFCIAILLLGAGSCKKNPIEPPDEEQENLKPGRRDYTWAADTVKNPYLDFYHIWGNSLANIWTGGMLSSNALYRYDGTKWLLDNRVYLPTPAALWGYGDKVWIGNYNGCLWQFTRDTYKEQISFQKMGDTYVQFINMVGSSNNEVYVTGAYHQNGSWYTLLMKYDGIKWSLDKNYEYPTSIMQLSYSPQNDRYYWTEAYPDNSGSFVEYDRVNIKVIRKFNNANTAASLATMDGYEYIVSDRSVYKYYNDQTNKILDINNNNFGGIVWGRGRNDMFIRMFDGIAHYNGTDVQYLFKIPQNYRMNSNMQIFEKDVFISAKDFNTGYNIIYHGKLN
jgi:hypothetical protein